MASICVGGIVGAGLRWLIAQSTSGDHLWPTLTANVIGCLVLGITGALLAEAQGATQVHLIGVAIGFCGSLTTFSGFAVEVAQRLEPERLVGASSYLATSVVMGAGALLVGTTIGNKILHHGGWDSTRSHSGTGDRK